MYDSPSAQEREVVAARHKSNINLFVIIHNPFYFVYFNGAILVCAVKEIYFSLFAINLVHFGIMPLFRCIFVLYCALAQVNDADAANISISAQRMFFFLSICCHLVGSMLAKL